MREDDCRIRRGKDAEMLTSFRHMAVNMLNNTKTFKAGLKRKKAAMSTQYLSEVLAAGFHGFSQIKITLLSLCTPPVYQVAGYTINRHPDNIPIIPLILIETTRRCPFAPPPLQKLLHYNEQLRPSAWHRYSVPCGFGNFRFIPGEIPSLKLASNSELRWAYHHLFHSFHVLQDFVL